ncbi:molybdopterin-dependent oxidoreductase [Shewanella eurypsychrophilus]|uniref:Molybdopterin-dependent oxidoreductase n=1 Tax=Shewanella eurypsychrophilus TaxID=2593656 RepID=A0ABX6VBH9_9GAMM|nr:MULTISPECIES: DMSO/selenate family reductase complex A subunit [Shewanella]QFU24794.1 molybdopterin-dependent oxidoreductase [Shewanella sp. YLB-09]QPG59983.1 molybdopterin-dependent oxidoreductase [Shewanella eurypsychrophilus]
MKRRDFLKVSAAAAAATAITGCDSSSAEDPILNPGVPVTPPTGEKITWSNCASNCFQSCPLKVHSKDGVVTRIEAEQKEHDDWDTFEHEIRPCLRGRSMRQKAYNADRLKYPMKRVGPRGSGEFVRIDWEEAFSEVARMIQETTSNYGKNSIYVPLGGGSHDLSAGAMIMGLRLLSTWEGCLFFHNDYSASQYREGSASMYGWLHYKVNDTVGFWNTGNRLRDLEHSDLMLCFGYNPMEARMGGAGSGYENAKLKQKNSYKTYYIDPRFTDTAVAAHDEWVPIRPGTDAALCEGIAHHLISNDLHEKEFLEKFCMGFTADTLPEGAPANGDYYSHIMGLSSDGIEKTPEWAESITGVSAEKIREIADALANANAPFVTQGFGMQRQGNGENNAKAVLMLPILIGKIVGKGINHGGTPGAKDLAHYKMMPADSLKDLMNLGFGDVSIPAASHLDAIEFGTEMKPSSHDVRYSDATKMANDDALETNVRMLWLTSSNMIAGQNADHNRAHRLLENPGEYIDHVVVFEQHMTGSAKYADILLPEISWLEMYDVIQSVSKYDDGSLRYIYGIEPAMEPMFECLHSFDICRGIARHLGTEGKFEGGKTYKQWVEDIFKNVKKNNPWLKGDSFDEFVKVGPQREEAPEHPNLQCLRDFINTNPRHPEFDNTTEGALSTPSGKIEIYSQTFAAKIKHAAEGDTITAIPVYDACEESYEDESFKDDFPYQCINYHGKHSAHSIHASTPWINEVVEHHLWVNPNDATKIGVINGQKARVTSKRGAIEITVRVTPRIVPGVVALPQGAWRKKRSDGVDTGGAVNTLTSSKPSPVAKSIRSNTNRVRIQPA